MIWTSKIIGIAQIPGQVMGWGRLQVAAASPSWCYADNTEDAMGEGHEYVCDACQKSVRTFSDIEFTRNIDGRILDVSHHIVWANQPRDIPTGFCGWYAEAYCPDCDVVIPVVTREFINPVYWNFAAINKNGGEPVLKPEYEDFRFKNPCFSCGNKHWLLNTELEGAPCPCCRGWFRFVSGWAV